MGDAGGEDMDELANLRQTTLWAQWSERAQATAGPVVSFLVTVIASSILFTTLMALLGLANFISIPAQWGAQSVDP